jgi:hypothetical protein
MPCTHAAAPPPPFACAHCDREALAAWKRRWASLRAAAEHDRDRAILSFPPEARLQGEVERAAMIAVLKEMDKLETKFPCVSTTKDDR